MARLGGGGRDRGAALRSAPSALCQDRPVHHPLRGPPERLGHRPLRLRPRRDHSHGHSRTQLSGPPFFRTYARTREHDSRSRRRDSSPWEVLLGVTVWGCKRPPFPCRKTAPKGSACRTLPFRAGGRLQPAPTARLIPAGRLNGLKTLATARSGPRPITGRGVSVTADCSFTAPLKRHLSVPHRSLGRQRRRAGGELVVDAAPAIRPADVGRRDSTERWRQGT